MLESIVSQSKSALRQEKYWICFSKQQFHQNKTLKLGPKTHMWDFKNEYCI